LCGGQDRKVLEVVGAGVCISDIVSGPAVFAQDYALPAVREDGVAKDAVADNLRKIGDGHPVLGVEGDDVGGRGDVASDGVTRLEEVQAIVVWGEEDGWLNPSQAPRLQEQIPGSELKLIQEAGHFVQENAPEEIAKVLAGFFSGDRE
jgi:pimeloyl-ACP methyl ester carboxylesterase